MKKKKGKKWLYIILIAIGCVIGYLLYEEEPEETPDTHQTINIGVYPGQKE